MGTHSTVKFYNRGQNILNIYNQFDGYVSGEGQEIINFLKKEEGNGFEDTALLYVCYKKDGKPFHTYATTENDIQEYNYKIYNTEEGLRFTIQTQTWNDKDQMCLVTLLNYKSFGEFKDYVKTQVLFDKLMYKHCEEIPKQLRDYFSTLSYDDLVEKIKSYHFEDVLEEEEK